MKKAIRARGGRLGVDQEARNADLGHKAAVAVAALHHIDFRSAYGHADIKMTLRYAHLCPGTLAAAVAKLR